MARGPKPSPAPPPPGLARTINWNLLHTFVVITDEQNLSRAAEVLGRGQPAISAALKRLEEQLGCHLAHRDSTRFILTDAGKVLYREAKEIAGSINRLSTVITDLAGDLTGTVHLSMASHMTSPLINAAFTAFHRRHPRATFNVTTMPTPEIIDSMSKGLIYFGIGPTYQQREDFDYFHVFREHCAFYCGPGHRLFGRKRLGLEDLAHEPAVTYKVALTSNALQSITDMNARVGFAEPYIGLSSDMAEVRRIILAGIAIGAIPIHIAQRDEQDGLLWRLPPYEPTMPIDVYLITNPRVTPSRTEQAFIDILRDLVDSTPETERTYPPAALVRD